MKIHTCLLIKSYIASYQQSCYCTFLIATLSSLIANNIPSTTVWLVELLSFHGQWHKLHWTSNVDCSIEVTQSIDCSIRVTQPIDCSIRVFDSLLPIDCSIRVY